MNRWIWIGGTGSIATGLCCVTPIAVIALAAVGAGGAAAYLDLVLLPALGFFLAVLAIGVWRWRRKHAGGEPALDMSSPQTPRE